MGKSQAGCPAGGLEVVEYGWEQHVIIDKVKNRVYRYPRHSDAAAKLADEVAVLQTIHQQTWPILLPALIECGKLFSTYLYTGSCTRRATQPATVR